ncbi:MAG: hypothetical protein QG597_3240 [Actinomycetota bacterium]|nr:hypothetical protein [Actinomycetota bacterium]
MLAVPAALQGVVVVMSGSVALLTLVAVLLGVGGLAVGWAWANTGVGLMITFALLGVLRSGVRHVGARLMDALEPKLMIAARSTIDSTQGVQSVTALRIALSAYQCSRGGSGWSLCVRPEGNVQVQPVGGGGSGSWS